MRRETPDPVYLWDCISDTICLQFFQVKVYIFCRTFTIDIATIPYVTGVYKTFSMLCSIPSAELYDVHILIAERNCQVNVNTAIIPAITILFRPHICP